MRRRTRPGFAAGLVACLSLTCAWNDSVGQPKVLVSPSGTNALQIALSPVVLDAYYSVMVRRNEPDGRWVHLWSVAGGTNSTVTAVCELGNGGVSSPEGLSVDGLPQWTFASFVESDSDGDGLSDSMEELVTLTDPWWQDTGNTGVTDYYRDPDRDNWTHGQEVDNATDPLEWDNPRPPSAVSVNVLSNSTAIVKWMQLGDNAPDYFIVERAERTLSPRAVRTPLGTYTVARPRPGESSNPYVTGEPTEVARVPGVPGKRDYSFVATNINTLTPPAFRVQSHYTPPPRLVFSEVTAENVRRQARVCEAVVDGDSFELRPMILAPHTRHLILARPSADFNWYASGRLVVTESNSPVDLRTDSRGIMSAATQTPLPLPEVRFVKSASNMEFCCGSGEDSDGDGLPDLYEVFVTHTDPADSTTGTADTLDGFLDLDHDGWPNVEEFLRRTDPLTKDVLPEPEELVYPSLHELMKKLLSSTVKTDLPIDTLIECKKLAERDYKLLDWKELQAASGASPPRSADAPLEYDFRIHFKPKSRPGQPPQSSDGF